MIFAEATKTRNRLDNADLIMPQTIVDIGLEIAFSSTIMTYLTERCEVLNKKVVASSEHESSIKPDSGGWFIRWQCKVLSQSFVILSLDPYRL